MGYQLRVLSPKHWTKFQEVILSYVELFEFSVSAPCCRVICKSCKLKLSGKEAEAPVNRGKGKVSDQNTAMQ